MPGAEVAIDLEAAPAPAWLQLLAKGLKIEAPARICHPFRGGQFGWTADIRRLVNGKWVKLATTADWVPSREGKFMACAQAPAAGTYALFGYYREQTAAIAPTCLEGLRVSAHGYSWNSEELRNIYFMFEPVLPEGTEVSIEVRNDQGITVLNGSATVLANGSITIAGSLSYSEDEFYFDFFFTTPEYCTLEYRMYFGD